MNVQQNRIDIGGTARDQYLELLTRALLGELSEPSELLLPIGTPRSRLKRLVSRAMARRGLVLAQRVDEEPADRLEGRLWPAVAMTMIGRKRLENVRACIEDVLASRVPGDCIETGVWRGGASMFMRAVLNVYGEDERRVWVADSFQGLPPPDPRYPEDGSSTFHTHTQLAVPLEEVKENFDRFGLLGGTQFLAGWFVDTLPQTRGETWAVIRLDGDMYQSTLDALTNLYPNLAPGGWCIIDDYYLDACRLAVEDYRREHTITESLHEIDWTGVCWKRRTAT